MVLMAAPIFTSSYDSLLAFCGFEALLGVYWPSVRAAAHRRRRRLSPPPPPPPAAAAVARRRRRPPPAAHHLPVACL